MFTLGLIVLVVVASATTVVATSIVSTPVISIAAIVSAAVLALVRSDAFWSIYAAPIISAATVSATTFAAGLTLIWATTIDSFLSIAITTGLALIGPATGRTVAAGIAIFRAVSARLTAIASRAFFLRVVTDREGHLGR
jgi:hypothetical protein